MGNRRIYISRVIRPDHLSLTREMLILRFPTPYSVTLVLKKHLKTPYKGSQFGEVYTPVLKKHLTGSQERIIKPDNLGFTRETQKSAIFRLKYGLTSTMKSYLTHRSSIKTWYNFDTQEVLYYGRKIADFGSPE